MKRAFILLAGGVERLAALLGPAAEKHVGGEVRVGGEHVGELLVGSRDVVIGEGRGDLGPAALAGQGIAALGGLRVQVISPLMQSRKP